MFFETTNLVTESTDIDSTWNNLVAEVWAQHFICGRAPQLSLVQQNISVVLVKVWRYVIWKCWCFLDNQYRCYSLYMKSVLIHRDRHHFSPCKKCLLFLVFIYCKVASRSTSQLVTCLERQRHEFLNSIYMSWLVAWGVSEPPNSGQSPLSSPSNIVSALTELNQWLN